MFVRQEALRLAPDNTCRVFALIGVFKSPGPPVSGSDMGRVMSQPANR